MKRITICMLAVAAAMLASGQPAMAASCNGNGHQIVLSNGSASPGAGTTSTAIRFSVRYADTDGCAPSRVVVVVQGVGTYPLSGSGSDYTAGVTFSRTLSLPAGSHAYSFKATSGKKAAALSSVSPSKVTITAPTPRPTPAQRQPPHRHRRRRPPSQPQQHHRAPPPPAPTAAPTARPTASPTADATSSQPDRSPIAPAVVAPSPTAIDGWWLAMRDHAPPGRPGSDRPRTPGAALEFVPELQPTLDDLAPFGILASFGLTTVGGLAFFFILLRTRRGNTMASAPLMTAAIQPATAGAAAAPALTHAPTTPAPRPGLGRRRWRAPGLATSADERADPADRLRPAPRSGRASRSGSGRGRHPAVATTERAGWALRRGADTAPRLG